MRLIDRHGVIAAMKRYGLYLESGPKRKKTMVHVLASLPGCVATGPTTEEAIAATPAVKGRTERAILLHVLGPTGAYLSAALGGAKGFSALHRAAERGAVPIPEALRRAAEMAEERVRATTPAERAAVRELPSGPRSLRKQMRRMLEHDWEHLAELSRRPGGPEL